MVSFHTSRYSIDTSTHYSNQKRVRTFMNIPDSQFFKLQTRPTRPLKNRWRSIFLGLCFGWLSCSKLSRPSPSAHCAVRFSVSPRAVGPGSVTATAPGTHGDPMGSATKTWRKKTWRKSSDEKKPDKPYGILGVYLILRQHDAGVLQCFTSNQFLGLRH